MSVARNYLPYFVVLIAFFLATATQLAVADESDQVGPYGRVIPLSVLGKAAIGVQIKEIEKTALPMEIKVPGRIEGMPTRQYDVHAPLSGRITSILVTPGAAVKQGQMLAIIDSLEMNSLAAQLLQSKLEIESENAKQKGTLDEEVRQAEQRLQLATANQKRMLKLYENKIAPQKDVMAAESEYNLAQTRLQTATTNRKIVLKTLQSKIDLTLLPLKQRLRLLGVNQHEMQEMLDKQKTLTSVPIMAARAGVVTSILASPGKSVDPSVLLFTIADLSKIWATAQVYEDDMSRMKVGERVNVKVQAVEGETVSGVLTYIGNEVDPVTRTLPVRAEIDNSNFRLKPDMYAELSIETAQSTAIIALPKDAIVQKNGLNIVFVENRNGYQPVYVRTGRTVGNTVEVTAGLAVGQRVVTRGAFQLGAQLLKLEDGSGMFSSPLEGPGEPEEKEIVGKPAGVSLNLQTVLVGVVGAFLLGFLLCALVLFRKPSQSQAGIFAQADDGASVNQESLSAEPVTVERQSTVKSKIEG